jgi:hypothetical protein
MRKLFAIYKFSVVQSLRRKTLVNYLVFQGSPPACGDLRSHVGGSHAPPRKSKEDLNSINGWGVETTTFNEVDLDKRRQKTVKGFASYARLWRNNLNFTKVFRRRLGTTLNLYLASSLLIWSSFRTSAVCMQNLMHNRSDVHPTRTTRSKPRMSNRSHTRHKTLQWLISMIHFLLWNLHDQLMARVRLLQRRAYTDEYVGNDFDSKLYSKTDRGYICLMRWDWLYQGGWRGRSMVWRAQARTRSGRQISLIRIFKVIKE